MMLPFFGGGRPEDIREFVSRFAEALLTLLFARFDLDMGQIEMATIEVLNAVDDDLAEVPEVASMSSFGDEPEALALSIAGDREMRELFLPEGPRTVDSVVEGTILLVQKLNRVQFLLSALLED